MHVVTATVNHCGPVFSPDRAHIKLHFLLVCWGSWRDGLDSDGHFAPKPHLSFASCLNSFCHVDNIIISCCQNKLQVRGGT